MKEDTPTVPEAQPAPLRLQLPWLLSALALLVGAGAGVGLAWRMQTVAVAAPPKTTTGAALGGSADEVQKTGVKGVRPHLQAALQPAAVSGEPQLSDVLAHVKDEAVKAAYEGREAPLLIDTKGLNATGRLVVEGLKMGAAHGLTNVEAEIGAALGLLETLAPPPVRPPPPPITEEDVRAALGRKGAGSLRAKVAEKVPPPPDATESLAARRATLGAVEAKLVTLLAKLADGLRHRPRETQAHVQGDDYLSPDVLWQAAEKLPLEAGDVRTLLAAAVGGEAALKAHMQKLLPPGGQYARLLDAHDRYRKLCAAGGWQKIEVPKFPRGSRWSDEAGISEVQSRLAAEGFFSGAPTGVWDEPTLTAVRAYQEARDLKVSGALTPETAEDLNIPCERRLKVLGLNLRRWRHTALTSETSYIFVTLPAFEARHVTDGELKSLRRVVVGSGKSYKGRTTGLRVYRNKTPLLRDEIISVTINPRWTMPQRIVREDIIPQMEKDPDYLKKKGFVAKRVNGILMVIQPPGPNNALGDVKFVFTNKESIYMHDTDKPYYFSLPKRDFSHGCVRVHKAIQLATDVLEHDHQQRGSKFWGGLTLLAKKNKTAHFKVDKPLAVFLEYYTASVDDAGRVRFHPDIYDYDAMTLDGEPPPIEKKRRK